MIFEINQFGYKRDRDEYTISLNGENLGQFVIADNDNFIEFHTDDNFDSKKTDATKAIFAIFKRPVNVFMTHTKKPFLMHNFAYDGNIFVLLKQRRSKYNEKAFFRFDERIGHVIKNKKDITFNAIFAVGDYLADDIANGARQLLQKYKNNINLNIGGRNYIINSNTHRSQIVCMCQDSIVPCYYDGKVVGTYKYTTNGIEFEPDVNIPLKNATKGALFLQSISGKQVTFIYPNKQYHTLMKLYAREQWRKQNVRIK